PRQVRNVLADGGYQLLILHVPDGLLRRPDSQVGQVSNQLPEAHVRRQLAQPLQQLQDLLALCGNHGSKSPIAGRCPTGAGRSATTSPGMSVRGESWAIRVARVTPLYSWNSPSEPRYAQGAGMPAVEEPNCAICRCNLNGSAPDARDGGRWSVRG